MKFVRRVAATNGQHTDPLKDELFAIAGRCTGDASNDVDQFLALRQMFTDELMQSPGFRDCLVKAYDALGHADAAAVFGAIDIAA